jgi:hypothetical protein
MRRYTILSISFLLFFVGLPLFGQIVANPRLIKVKGDYIHRPTRMIFPLQLDKYERTDINAFNKDRTDICVSYSDNLDRTKISLYVYPADNGYEGRLRKEYFKSMQSIANFSNNGIHANQSLVRHEGEKYICNGVEAILAEDGSPHDVLQLFECGRWFFKIRVTTNELDSVQLMTLLQTIKTQNDPTKLTEFDPLDSLANVIFSRSAFGDSLLLGSSMGSAFKKIEWSLANVKLNERASGFPDIYLNMQIESLKAFISFQSRVDVHISKVSDYTKKYLSDLNQISNAGFLAEFIMDELDYLLIIPNDQPYRISEYLEWKKDKNLSIDFKERFSTVVYGKRK